MSPKVDFTTFKEISGMPTVSTVVRNAGSDTEIRVVRRGNLVTANGTFVSAGIGQYDQTDIATVFPEGYRPSSAYTSNDGSMVYLPFVCTTANPSVVGGWTIYSNGKMRFSNAVAVPGQSRHMYNGSWYTDDDWPS